MTVANIFCFKLMARFISSRPFKSFSSLRVRIEVSKETRVMNETFAPEALFFIIRIIENNNERERLSKNCCG